MMLLWLAVVWPIVIVLILTWIGWRAVILGT